MRVTLIQHPDWPQIPGEWNVDDDNIPYMLFFPVLPRLSSRDKKSLDDVADLSVFIREFQRISHSVYKEITAPPDRYYI